VNYPEPVEGPKIRRRSEKFKDYFSQARLFFNSMSPIEKQHMIDAARFELGRVESPVVRQRMVALFDLVDRDLATGVAERIGVTPPTGAGVEISDASGVVLHRQEPPVEDGRWVDVSPALSQMNTVKNSIKSRRVAVLVAPGFDGTQLQTVKAALEAQGGHPDIISLGLGVVKAADGTPVPVDKTSQVAASVQYDAVFVPGGAASVEALRQLPEVAQFVAEALRHGKAIGMTGEAVQLLADVLASDPSAKRNGNDGSGANSSLGIIASADASNLTAFVEQFVAAIAQHRFPEREGARGGIGASRDRAG